MEDKSSPALKQILSKAAQLAAEFDCDFISSEHLLRAILGSEHCPDLKIDQEDLKLKFRDISYDQCMEKNSKNTLPTTLDENARLCLESAARLALSNKSESTEPTHLLSVLLSDQNARTLLQKLSVSVRKFKQQLQKLLNGDS